jgi:hypothetical protein
MNLLKNLSLIIVAAQLGGCAVMSKSECLSANWQNVGYDVGFRGQRDISNAFNARANACAKHGSRANWPEFKSGHAEGIDQFCQIDNALLLGIKGRNRALDDHVCPERIYPEFAKTFVDGYKLYELNSYVYSSEEELSRLENLVYRYRKKRSNLKRQIKSGELGVQEEQRADFTRKQLRRDIIAINTELYACRERLARDRAHAQSYAEFLELEYGGISY